LVRVRVRELEAALVPESAMASAEATEGASVEASVSGLAWESGVGLVTASGLDEGEPDWPA
jgi:hypothetical protein